MRVAIYTRKWFLAENELVDGADGGFKGFGGSGDLFLSSSGGDSGPPGGVVGQGTEARGDGTVFVVQVGVDVEICPGIKLQGNFIKDRDQGGGREAEQLGSEGVIVPRGVLGREEGGDGFTGKI